jgi:hypothetical protein
MSRVFHSRPLVGLRSKTSLNTYGDLSAGLAINKVRVPEGRLKLVLGCYESGVPDRLEAYATLRRRDFEVGTRRPVGRMISILADSGAELATASRRQTVYEAQGLKPS